MLGPAGPDERDDDKQQARRRDDLAEQDRRAATLMCEVLRMGSLNMASASAALPMAPATWQAMTAAASARPRWCGVWRPRIQSAAVTTGLKCAPPAGMNTRDQDGQAERGDHRVDQQLQRSIMGEPGGGDARPDHDRHQQAGADVLGRQAPADGSHVVAGLTARMIAEYIPGPASVVKVTDASANPAAVSPLRYSVRDRAPAMQPT